MCGDKSNLKQNSTKVLIVSMTAGIGAYRLGSLAMVIKGDRFY